jgi:hypothetical protein
MTSGRHAVFVAWHEHRFTLQCCRDLLALHSRVLASHPGLAGLALYRQIVATHVGGDLATAEQVLQQAEESYSVWPTPRSLSFRDVVHYLAASALVASQPGKHWVSGDIQHIVQASIPHEL